MTNTTPDPEENQRINDQKQEDIEVIDDSNVTEEREELEYRIEELTQLDTKLDELDKYLDQLEERNESLKQQLTDFLQDIKNDKK